ncbi:peptidyl-tRNA hydrolase Pth2 [Candidatus Micrarchaeota archaeon]|nr:peptidyl-tRNA hydrolase Pth2 [Candidatus Micrarchaeota archaeon]MBU1930781.1 peptidyl-tRNA hydrolase Pth2 [Candidatus Micrarchaeota archaeon]
MEFKQAIVIRTDLGMGKGKIAAQSSHASVTAVEKTQQQELDWLLEWKNQGQAKIVLKVNSKKELLELFDAAKKKLPTALIKDAGRTQIAPGEPTAIAIGPAPEHLIDQFTKHLKLL